MTAQLAALVARIESMPPDELEPEILTLAASKLRAEATGAARSVYLLLADLLEAASDLITNLRSVETGG